MNEQETIADIVAEMRSDANADEYTPDGILGQTLNCLADRLEAAHKREVAVSKTETTTNAAKLREALKLCVDEMCDRCRELAVARGNPLPCLSGCEPVRRAKAALAATEKEGGDDGR